MTEPGPQNKIIYYLGEFWKNQTYLAIVVFLAVLIALVYGVFSLTQTALSFIDVPMIVALSKEETKGQINAEARGYLRAAEKITGKYIIPSGIKKGAYKNSKTLMCKIRDDLYSKGMNLLDPDDGEREIWWWKIRYKEFETAYGKQLPNKYNSRYNPEPKPKEKEKLFEWHYEILEHIKTFPDAKPKDKQYLKRKFAMFILMLEDFLWRSIQIIDVFDISTDEVTKNKTLKKCLESMDNRYVYYKSFVKEKEGFDYVQNNTDLSLKEIVFRERVSRNILAINYFLKELDCNNKYFDIFTNSVYKKLAYMKEHRDSISSTAYLYLGVKGYGIIKGKINNIKVKKQKIQELNNLCKNQPGYQKYYNFLNEAREIAVNRKDKSKISESNKLYQLQK